MRMDDLKKRGKLADRQDHRERERIRTKRNDRSTKKVPIRMKIHDDKATLKDQAGTVTDALKIGRPGSRGRQPQDPFNFTSKETLQRDWNPD